MVTFVVNSFLPWTIDFHEFELDPAGKAQRAAAANRKNLATDLRKLMITSRESSVVDLSSLTKGESSKDVLLYAKEDSPPPSLFDERERDASPPSGRLIACTKRNPSYKDLFSQTKLATSGRSGKMEPVNWLRPEFHATPDVETETLDQANAQRMDSVVSAAIASALESITAPPPTPTISHSRTSSLLIDASNTYTPYVFDDSRYTFEKGFWINGGLIHAANASVPGKATEKIWVGSMGGLEMDRISLGRKQEISDRFANEYGCHAVWITDKDLSGHYEHFCKIIMWPVLHYHMPDNPKAKAYEEKSYQYYVTVNKQYADKVLASYKQGDTIWVHDYHLMLVPQLIRSKRPEAKIGFFLHTGFPSPEIWRCVCSRVELLEGVLGANVVGFQTPEYAFHFRQTCSRMLVTQVSHDGVFWDDRFINVISQPIGLVHEAIDTVRREEEDKIVKEIRSLEKEYKGKTLIVARDKLDNVRGLRQKLLAYEYLLDNNPDLYKKVMLIQIATSTTELVELQTSVWDIVDRIFKKYNTLEYTTLEFTTKDMQFTEYLGMISAADVLLLTTLREGMGLTAQEFVYCQDGWKSHKKHGVVVLSEFCGTSSLFAGNDLPCNPWDTRQTAEQILTAINLSAEEKKARWRQLRGILEYHTGGRWWAALQRALDKSYLEQNAHMPENIPRVVTTDVVDGFGNSNKRLLIIDHEGTLASDTALPTHRAAVRTVLRKLVEDPCNVVYITSSLSQSELMEYYEDIPRLGLIADNGHFTHTPDTPPDRWFEASSTSRAETWKAQISRVLQYYMSRLEGATISETLSTIKIDFGNAFSAEAGLAIMGDLVLHINESCRELGVHATPVIPASSKQVIISSIGNDKCAAVKAVYEAAGGVDSGFDFIFAAGDSHDDEDVFVWVKNARDESARRRPRNAAGHRRGGTAPIPVFTLALGNAITAAEATLSGGPGALVHLLERLTGYYRVMTDERRRRGLGYRPVPKRWQGGVLLPFSDGEDDEDDSDGSPDDHLVMGFRPQRQWTSHPGGFGEHSQR